MISNYLQGDPRKRWGTPHSKKESYYIETSTTFVSSFSWTLYRICTIHLFPYSLCQILREILLFFLVCSLVSIYLHRPKLNKKSNRVWANKIPLVVFLISKVSFCAENRSAACFKYWIWWNVSECHNNEQKRGGSDQRHTFLYFNSFVFLIIYYFSYVHNKEQYSSANLSKSTKWHWIK